MINRYYFNKDIDYVFLYAIKTIVFWSFKYKYFHNLYERSFFV